MSGDVWTSMIPDLGPLNPLINKSDRKLEKIGKGVSPRNMQAQQALGALQGLAVRNIEQQYLKDPPPATFRVNVNPLVTWIWVGGAIAVIGGLVAIWPAPEARRRRVSDVYAARLARSSAAHTTSVEVVLAVLIVAIVVWFVSVPLRRTKEEEAAATQRIEDPRVAELEARKEAKYREIRDAELDREQGKLSQADWRRQDAELRRDAVKILKELDEAKADAERSVPAER